MRLLLICASLMSTLAANAATAADCRWTAASGNWTDASAWLDCATGSGSPVGTPGANDHVHLEAGVVTLPQGERSIATLQFDSGARLSHAANQFATLIVEQSLQWNGGRVETIVGGGIGGGMRLVVAAAASAQLTAAASIGRYAAFENRGSLVLDAPAAADRIDLEGSAELLSIEGSSFSVLGDAALNRTDASSNGAAFVKLSGDTLVQGPGTLALDGIDGSKRLNVELRGGTTTVRNATVQITDNSARFDLVDDDASTLDDDANLRLENGVLALGGASYSTSLLEGSLLSGSGSWQANVSVRGRIDPGEIAGPDYGSLAITGSANMQNTARLQADLGGNTPQTSDRLTVGSLQLGSSANTLVLDLRFAPAVSTALGAEFPLIGYTSVEPSSDAAVRQIVANVPRDFATRFGGGVLSALAAPRVLLDTLSVPEGNSGNVEHQLPVRLSEPAPFPVTVRVTGFSDGSAVRSPVPADFSGDPYLFLNFAPGQTELTVPVTIHGDTVLEANEQFTMNFRRGAFVDVAAGNGVIGDPTRAVTITSEEIATGTRYVLMAGGGRIRRFTTDGILLDTWVFDSGAPLSTTGMCFAPNGDILATRFDTAVASDLIRFGHDGAVLNNTFAAPKPSAIYAESCVFDQAGNVYVGHAGLITTPSPDTLVPIQKFDRHGNWLDTFVVPTGTRGTDWIDLDADQCTLYYTSEDDAIRRYNLCTRSPLPVLASGLEAPCFALRRRPNGEVMVACRHRVYRLDREGDILREYSRESLGENDSSGLFALNLDPDGTSFWTAGIVSNRVVRADIASGAMLSSFTPPQSGQNGGLAIYDEIFGIDSPTLFGDGFE
ncbi:MAG: hypothetical protein IPH76_06580 [Xanthomonadales bacterium]|nr:hypothetical protein [Xanthomonadales bacterium]